MRIDRLSTADVPPSQRHTFWKGLFAEPERSMAIAGEPEMFHGALTRLTVGELKLMSVNSSPLVTRSAARDTSDEKRFSLHLVHSGRCRLRLGDTDFAAETAT